MQEVQQRSEAYDYLRAILLGLVEDERALSLREIRGERTILFELRVAESDARFVLGKSGKTADAIRTLLYTCAKKYKLGIISFNILNGRAE